MISTQEHIRIDLSSCTRHLYLWFKRNTDRAVYDICDIHGRILKTGTMNRDKVKIPLDELENDDYVVLVLDGDRVFNRKFTLSR